MKKTGVAMGHVVMSLVLLIPSCCIRQSWTINDGLFDNLRLRDDQPIGINSTASEGVLTIPSTVVAGEPTIWQLNISKADQDYAQHTRMKIYLYTWPKTSDQTDFEPVFSSLYCYIVQCAWTNLTSFEVTIPRDMFPPDIRIRTGYSLTDSPVVGYSTWGGDSTQFMLEGGTGQWSSYESIDGWTPVNSVSTRLACTKVTCARSCIEQYVDPAKNVWYNQTQVDKENFRACLDKCGPDPIGERAQQCLTTNVTVATSVDDNRPNITSDDTNASGATPASNSAAILKGTVYLVTLVGVVMVFVLQFG